MAEEMVNAEPTPPPAVTGTTSLVPRAPFMNDALASHQFAQGQDGAAQNMIRQWSRLINRHKLLILSLLLLVVPFVTIQAYRAKPIYEATATIEVRSEDSAVLKSTEVMTYRTYDNTKAEVFILKSRPVLERTIAKLELAKNPLFLDAPRKRSIMEAVKALSGTDIELSKKKMLLESGALGQPNAQSAANTELDNVDLGLAIEREKTAAERERLAPYLEVLSSGLKVEPLRDTRLLKITYSHADPDIAAKVTNGIAHSFIDYNFATKTKRYDQTSGYLEETTRKLKAKVEEAEARLADYARTHNIYSNDEKEDLSTNKLAELHGLALKAETELMLKASLYEEVKQGRVQQLPEAFSDAKTADLRKELNEMEVEAVQLGVKFGPKHPRIQALRQQMGVLQEQINENRSMLEEKLRADFERAVRDEDSLKRALDKAKSEASQQNLANIEFRVLQQDLATAKSYYQEFLNKTSSANLQRMEQYNNVRLVESAEPPPVPIGPRRFTTVLAGIALSLLAGIGLAWLIENLNTSIRNMEDVARVTPWPILAVIPSLERQALHNVNREDAALGEAPVSSNTLMAPGSLAQTFLNDEYSTAAEAYRMLRTSMLLSTADHPPRKILVTSGQPGDGKTTTIFNTALAFTQLKSEVLIIDCDMRKPRLHKIAQVEKGRGLSNFLSSGADLADLIRPTGVPHLSILPSGPVPPNPSELISSNKMRELLALLQEKYDYILIDSPPLVTVTDPIILSTLVDGVILVAKSGRTKTDILRRAYHELATINAKVLGVVLNDFNLRRDGYQDYYYYYRYQYDYREAPDASNA